MELSKLLFSALMHRLRLVNIYFVELRHFAFLKFDSFSPLFNKLILLSFKLDDLRLHFLV